MPFRLGAAFYKQLGAHFTVIFDDMGTLVRFTTGVNRAFNYWNFYVVRLCPSGRVTNSVGFAAILNWKFAGQQ